MSRRSTRALFGALLFASLLSLNSCAWSVGSGKKTMARTHPTLGEELQDLKKACHDGAISEDEYEIAKQRLIQSADQRGG